MLKENSSKSFKINKNVKKPRKKNTRTDDLLRMRIITLYTFSVKHYDTVCHNSPITILLPKQSVFLCLTYSSRL